MTRTSTGPLAGASFSPSCSSSAAKMLGGWGRSGAGTARIARPPKPGNPQGLVRSETQIEIEFASESGFIQDRPVQYQCKLPYEVRHVDLAPFYVQQPCLVPGEGARDIATVDLPRDVSRRRAGRKRNAACFLRRRQFGAALCRRQIVDRELSRLPVKPQLEPVGQERLQHQPCLLLIGVALRFGLDIVAIGIDPGRTSYHLRSRQGEPVAVRGCRGPRTQIG